MLATPEQLARAAELAPRVLKRVDIPFANWPGHTLEILHIGNFQRIIHALSDDDYGWAMAKAAEKAELTYLEFIRHLLTPAGMLEVYEELVAQGEDE